MPHKHTVKSYDEELAQLHNKILEMGELADLQLTNAMEAFLHQDAQHAQRVIENDAPIDQLEQEIHKFVVHLLASRQPMAGDLRMIMTALQIGTDVERIADYAENIAKHTMPLAQLSLAEDLRDLVVNMADIAHEMLKNIVAVYQQPDVQQTRIIRERDQAIDQLYQQLLNQLQTCMQHDPQSVNACTSLLFIARCLERIGDHIKNVAEHIYFITTGELFTNASPQVG